MKKLFAGIVAALAFIPVVANAASYNVGDYVNYAGSDSDWSAFHAAGTPEQLADFWENTGVGTLYLGEGHTGYNRGLSLVANKILSTGLVGTPTAGTLFNRVVEQNRAEAVAPYGYATTASDGIDVTVATLADITALFGVEAINDEVELTDKNLTIFQMLADNENMPKNQTFYIFTSTEDTATAAGNYFAIELTRVDGVVTKAKLVSQAAATSVYAGLFSVIEMNKDYVCAEAPESSYVCYECTTEDNQTEYLWRIEGSQADNCKKSTKITSKAKCVKSPKTGVDSYLIPSAIVLGVCAIVLTVVKRKDAFKAI